MVRDEHGLEFGFKSCRILVFRWIWILEFLVKQIWVGIDKFVLNFATFDSFSGSRITIWNSLVQSSFSDPSRL